MTDQRASEDRGLTYDNPFAGASELSASSLCDPFVNLLPVTGASVSVIGLNGSQSTICASDTVASQIDELQFEYGEGPHWTAFRGARPVIIDDVKSDNGAGWPILAHAIKELDVGAMFSIPLLMGSVVVGVVDLYRTTPGWLRPRDLHRAATLAEAVAVPAVHSAVRDAEREHSSNSSDAPALRREVHQATGMVVVQLDLSATDALRRLKVEAFLTDRPIQDVARDVIARKIDLSRLQPKSERVDEARKR